jgi:hypothetical protein
MSRLIPLAIGLVATTLGLLLFDAPAHAQANRTWVSSGAVLEDAPCTRTQPCKFFSEAFPKTNAGGEISVLKSGHYGVLTITKSISIVAEGAEAGVSVANAAFSAITINAGSGDVVNLRGLVLDGHGISSSGINFVAGGALHVQNCLIKKFTNTGILFQPSGTSQLFVSDCIIVGNPGASPGIGISIRPTGSATRTIALNRARVENNTTGINANSGGGSGTINLAVRESLIAGNTGVGVQAVAPAGGGTVQLMADNVSSINNNNTGFLANGANATILISGSTVTGNNRGLRRANGGAIVSFGNNSVTGNTVDGTPSSTIALQ